MKLSRVEIRIGTHDEFTREISESFGKPTTGRRVLMIQAKFAQSFFTRRRMELLDLISRHPNAGVGELARLSGRKQEAVSRDVAFLRRSHLVIDNDVTEPFPYRPRLPAISMSFGGKPWGRVNNRTKALRTRSSPLVRTARSTPIRALASKTVSVKRAKRSR